MLPLSPIKNGLLFSTINNSDTDVVSSLFEKLKHSLSHALVHFYPLTGRLVTQQKENASVTSIEGGLGARLIRAAALDLTVSDIILPPNGVSKVDMIASFFDVGEKWNNCDGHSRALLSIQVTELLDGVFIGFNMNHLVGDGTTFVHFIKMLSEIFNYDGDLASVNEVIKISRPPVFNYNPWKNVKKEVVNNDENVNMNKFFDKYLQSDSHEPAERLSEKTFHFSSTSMAKLKAEANNNNNKHCDNNNVISSFQALSALVWRSIMKARNLPTGQPTICIIPMNIRTRLNPPLSDDYIGNFVSGVIVQCKVDELLGQDWGWAAVLLNKSIAAHKEEQILAQYKRVVNAPAFKPPANPLNVIEFAGSARLDMYGPQFGLGRALAVRFGFGRYEDGRVFLNPGSEEGSVDLEISINPETMSALEANEEFMSFATST